MSTGDLIQSINPATEEILATFQPTSAAELEAALRAAERAQRSWRRTGFAERATLMHRTAAHLRERQAALAALITAEMGKPIVESEAEVAKCAWNCDFYADNAERFLADEPHPSDASESFVQCAPLGIVLAIMPWNFPLWQLFRFAAPALMAGNAVILKHASNVPQCALAAEEVFRACGFPEQLFRTLFVPVADVPALIADPRIAAVTLTGSDRAGSEVAAAAGGAIKKTVLELGGADPFIVLADADLRRAVELGVRARYQNAGQSCIAAKRFVVVGAVFAEFEERFVDAVQQLAVGDPRQRTTRVGPLARDDLRAALERQVRASVARGARVLCGGARRPGRGYFFVPTVLGNVAPDMAAAREEVFGPVAALLRVADAEEALRTANASPYGLGASLWTADLDRGRQLARDIEAGQVFVNGMVVSDPRLPFGGVKRSGYGRELSAYGIREFVNVKTVWVGPAR